ncbi:MAG: hypothetical protein GY716_14040 [bacterium]|nr:hypothetical protein [bacterium]
MSKLHTVTHARLRARQGDVRGARAILHEILRRSPAHEEACRLFDELAHRVSTAHREREEAAPAPRQKADASGLATTFRAALGPRDRAARRRAERKIARLRGWLDRVERSAGGL